jgi:hypothetical protein
MFIHEKIALEPKVRSPEIFQVERTCFILNVHYLITFKSRNKSVSCQVFAAQPFLTYEIQHVRNCTKTLLITASKFLTMRIKKKMNIECRMFMQVKK